MLQDNIKFDGQILCHFFGSFTPFIDEFNFMYIYCLYTTFITALMDETYFFYDAEFNFDDMFHFYDDPPPKV